jgi:glycerol uptake facilitator-like aquaporin
MQNEENATDSNADPKVVALFADGPALAQLWLFWLAPLIGGAVGAFIWQAIEGAEEV